MSSETGTKQKVRGDIMVMATVTGSELYELLTKFIIEINKLEQAIILIPIVLLLWLCVWATWKYVDRQRK